MKSITLAIALSLAALAGTFAPASADTFQVHGYLGTAYGR